MYNQNSDARGLLMSKKDLEDLQKENKLLKEKIRKLEDNELKTMGGYEWAKTLSQEEVDYIVQFKIVEEMMNYNLESGDSPTKTIEKVLDFTNKDIDTQCMPEDLKDLLSLGLITKSVLAMSIAYFVVYLTSMTESQDDDDDNDGFIIG